ncbi:MAG: ABC transporter permease [Candidatus Heimdallarchaeota archaeon]|nr:ABC transporter permease [Candidatus Heimdallarchaeota archaeon]
MSITNTLLFFKVHFKNHITSKTGLLLALVFPLVFIAIFGIAFQDGPGQTTIELALLNQDTDGNLSGIYVNVLSDAEFEDGTPIFHLKSIEEETSVVEELQKNELAALLMIPENFTICISQNQSIALTLKGDITSADFSIANAVINDITNAFMGKADSSVVTVVSIAGEEEVSFFNLLVPAMLIFAILNNLGTVATNSLQDVKSGILDRLTLTKMKPYEYLSGLILSQLSIAFMQIPVVFGAAMLFGFPMSTQVFYAAIFIAFLAISATAMGIILATIFSDPNSVGGAAGLISTMMLFLAGAFVPLPNPELTSNFFGHKLHLFDALPATSVLNGLKQLLFYNASMADVMFELSMTIFVGLVLIAISITLYTRKFIRK